MMWSTLKSESDLIQFKTHALGARLLSISAHQPHMQCSTHGFKSVLHHANCMGKAEAWGKKSTQRYHPHVMK
jgi:hypothetical protein